MKRIILALDGIEIDDAKRIVEKTKDEIWGVKFNDLLLRYGSKIVEEFSAMTNVMADSKFYDIPKTIQNGLRTLINARASIVTIHCSVYFNPDNSYGSTNLTNFASNIAGITILTSFDEDICRLIYGTTIKYMVESFVHSAIDFKYQYIVCSGKELHLIKNINKYSEFKIKPIVPGIRPNWYPIIDDQKRTITPKEAIDLGAKLLVMGRPLGIKQNYDLNEIIESIDKTNEEIGE